MAEKDFREKRFEDFDDVFADIINGLIFGGETRVSENDLESGMPRSGVLPRCDACSLLRRYALERFFEPERSSENPCGT